MGLWLRGIVLCLSAVTVCAVMTRIAIPLALVLGAVAKRDSRRRHVRETPLLGGTGFYTVLVTMTLGLWLLPYSWIGFHLSGRFALCFLSAISVIFITGVVDDFHELKAPPKFAAQAVASILVLVASPHLPSILEGVHLPQSIIAVLLFFWIIGLSNAMNMIDGLDGLCAGVSGLSALTLAVIMIAEGNFPSFPAYIALAIASCCVGFLVFNFNPAQIFLGDSGSMLLGFVLAVVSVMFDVKRSLFVSLSMPIFLLGVPLMDVGLSMIRRKRDRRSLFKGDRGHLHHRLQQVGLSHRSAVLLLWTMSGYLNFEAFVLARLPVDHSIYVYMSVLPTMGFCLGTLLFLEKRLSYLTSQFSRLFLRKKNPLTWDRAGLLSHLQKLVFGFVQEGTGFTLMLFDSSDYLTQMAHYRPNKLVEFHMNLHSILSTCTREDDFIVHVSESVSGVIIEDRSETLAESVVPPDQNAEAIKAIKLRIKTLQENFGVFQSKTDDPEGLRVLNYPQDARLIWQALKVNPSDLTASAVAQLAIKPAA